MPSRTAKFTQALQSCAPKGLRHVAEGRAKRRPRNGAKPRFSSPDRGGGSSLAGSPESCRRPFGAWEILGPFPRGRRAFGALTPGYMPGPLRSALLQHLGTVRRPCGPCRGLRPRPGVKPGNGVASVPGGFSFQSHPPTAFGRDPEA